MSAGCLGVEAKGGLSLTSGQRAYLELVEARLGFTLTATSGSRSPEDQAAAMLNKLKVKGPGELRSLYRQNGALIEELLKASPTVPVWSAIIREKGMKLSRHLWGGAVDVRTRDLSSSQIQKVKDAVVATGGRPLQEYDHLHIDLPSSYAARSGGEVLVVRSFYGWIFAGGLLAVAIGVREWQKRRRV